MKNNIVEKAQETALLFSESDSIFQTSIIADLFDDLKIKTVLYRKANEKTGHSAPTGLIFLKEIRTMIQSGKFQEAEEKFSGKGDSGELEWNDFYFIAKEFYEKAEFAKSEKYLKTAEEKYDRSYEVDLLRLLLENQKAGNSRYEEYQDRICSKYLQLSGDVYLNLIGEKFYYNNEYSKSMYWVKNALKLNSSSPEIWENLGKCYYNQKESDLTEAEKCFMNTVSLNPTMHLSWYYLGQIYFSQSRYADAELSFRKTIEFFRYEVYFYSLGLSLAKQSKDSEAEVYLREAVVMKKDNESYWRELGQVQENLSKFEDAETSFREAVRLNSDLLNLIQLGFVLTQNCKYEEAELYFTKAAELNPESAMMWMYVGASQQRQQKPEAEASLQKAAELDPDRADIWFCLGTAKISLKKIAEAKECFLKTVSIEPSSVLYWQTLSKTYAVLKEYPEAVKACQIAYNLDPTEINLINLALSRIILNNEDSLEDLQTAALSMNYYQYFFTIGNTYKNSQLFSKAIENFEFSLALNRDNAECWWKLGDSQFGLSKFEEAEESFRNAAELNPDKDEYWHCLANTQSALKSFYKAEINYKKALGLNPNNDTYLYNLGMNMMELLDYEEAEACFLKSIEINPNIAARWYDLANAQLGLEKHSEAIKSFYEASRLEPDNKFYKTRAVSVETNVLNQKLRNMVYFHTVDRLPGKHKGKNP